MPQIGPMEILVVGILALMVFGPEKLPDMARSVGRVLSQVKTMASEAKSEFDMSLEDKDDDKKKSTAKVDDPVTDGTEVVDSEASSKEPALASKS